jgi:hypothetical protein
MTTLTLTLTLPNEIINKIFSYIEGNNNQIIKNGLTNTNWTNRNELFFEIKFEFDIIKHNLIRDKLLYNHKIIKYEKYFKYTILHIKRKHLFDYIKYNLREIIHNQAQTFSCSQDYESWRDYLLESFAVCDLQHIQLTYGNDAPNPLEFTYHNYTKILNEVRKNYIYECGFPYRLTLRQSTKYYHTHFKYTILHENRKKVCNDIKSYKLCIHPIFEKKNQTRYY